MGKEAKMTSVAVVLLALVVLEWIRRNALKNRVLKLDIKHKPFKALLEKKEKLRTYRPFWVWNGFFQTILFNYYMPAPQMQFRREIVYYEDGGSASIDWHEETPNTEESIPLSEGARPVCAIFPALGTSCRTKYIRHLCKYFAEQGFEIAVLNWRGSAGTPLTSHILYDIGKTDDVEFLIEHIEKSRPGSKIVAVGASMGSNIMVRYLCQPLNRPHPVVAAVSISNPFHLYKLMNIEQQWPFNLKYFRNKFESRFVEWFKRRLGRFEHHFRAEHVQYDFDEWLSHDTIDDFSNFAGKHVFGYEDFEAFLQAGSCYNFIQTLQVPTLFVQSLDDPLVPESLIPHEKLEKNQNANVIYTDSGGHIAFLDVNLKCWFLPVARAFLQVSLAAKEESK